MLSIVRKKYGLPINDIFFANDPEATDHLAPIAFFIQAKRPLPNFRPSKTSIINLRKELGDIFACLSSNTRYKIRRAERDGTKSEVLEHPDDEELSTFSAFFDRFAELKQIGASNRAKLKALRDKAGLLLFRAKDRSDLTCVAHAYVADRDSSRVRLLYSASHFRASDDTEARNRIGRANRLLHWFEIETAKRLGFEDYDLGGLPIDDRDPAKNAIARFKSEFGGDHVIEYNGFSSNHRALKPYLPIIQRILQ
jgi:lipid II:glycine glycyltransferase (peptidoglycan interpeptide bridge formation enzyme)